MLEIQEAEINLCDHSSPVYGQENAIFEKRYEDVLRMTGKPAEFVRIGFEFCENELFYTSSGEIANQFKFAEEKKLKTVFVLPPLHERSIERYGHFLKNTLLQLPVAEYVVNDLGTAYLLREDLNWKGPMTFGRLFDKSIREFRMDLSELIDVETYGTELFCPSVMSDYFRRVAEKLGGSAFETDTLPEGILHAQDWSNAYRVHVHYPRICLSRAAYCEYGQNGLCFDAGCGRACVKYGKRIGADEERVLYKEGLCVFGLQSKPLAEAVSGNIRLIYSGGGAR